jgi:hypothetical protein
MLSELAADLHMNHCRFGHMLSELAADLHMILCTFDFDLSGGITFTCHL